MLSTRLRRFVQPNLVQKYIRYSTNSHDKVQQPKTFRHSAGCYNKYQLSTTFRHLYNKYHEDPGRYVFRLGLTYGIIDVFVCSVPESLNNPLITILCGSTIGLLFGGGTKLLYLILPEAIGPTIILIGIAIGVIYSTLYMIFADNKTRQMYTFKITTKVTDLNDKEN